jgi:hypothetical protein
MARGGRYSAQTVVTSAHCTEVCLTAEHNTPPRPHPRILPRQNRRTSRPTPNRRPPIQAPSPRRGLSNHRLAAPASTRPPRPYLHPSHLPNPNGIAFPRRGLSHCRTSPLSNSPSPHPPHSKATGHPSVAVETDRLPAGSHPFKPILAAERSVSLPRFPAAVPATSPTPTMRSAQVPLITKNQRLTGNPQPYPSPGSNRSGWLPSRVPPALPGRC